MKNIYFTIFLALLTTTLFSQDEELIPGAVVGSCVEPDSNLITIFFDYSKNCPEADPAGNLAGAAILGFHSGINDWATIVEFDNENTMPMTNIGNDIFMIKINTMDYYGSSLNDIEEVNFLMRSADPNNGWDDFGTCKDDQGGGGFGGDEPCNNFILSIVNLPICSEVEAESSVSVLGPTTAANSCIDSTNNTVRIDFDYGLNCPEADPGNLLRGAAELGFHSGANDWESVVAWDDEGALKATNNGNDIFSVTLDPMAYYGVALDDLENIVMIMNNGVADPENPWDNTGKDERDGGFGGAEPCSDLVFSVAEAGFCPVVIELASSESVLQVFGEVATCVDPNRGRVRISFDLSRNCPEADPDNVLAGVNALGFHSGANNWANTVQWDSPDALQATNDGNDVFTVTIDVMEYYGIPFDSLRNIEFLLNNGIANPSDAWAVTGKDPRDGGGFGNVDPCSNLLLDISEASECDLPDMLTSVELVSGLAGSCVDMANGKIQIDWDRNLNCPEADSANALGETIIFHSGVNGWTNQVPWDDENVMKPSNDGNGLYSMVIDVQDYYGVAIGEVTEVNFLFNNGVDSPDDPWSAQGQANQEGGGFGGNSPCSNFLFVLSEAPACDLVEELSSNELFEGLASSCVDAATGRIRIDFDRALNCPEADPENLLGDTIGFHSGINGWSVQRPWDSEIAEPAINDGSGLYRLVLDVQEYYGVPLDSINEINFLYNNGFAAPSDAWSVTGKDAKAGGGFGNDEPCSNFLLVLSEAPSCDLADKVSSNALISGLAASCIDPDNGKIRIDFDYSLNCSDADPGSLLMDAAQIGFHSGINGWQNQKPWDDEGAKPAENNGENVFTVVIDAMDYYGVPLSQIDEINFLYNNGFGNPDAPWDNTGKDDTGGGGFGGEDPCNNFLFAPGTSQVCDLSTSTVDLVLERSLRVMPNPFSNEVLIQFDNPLNKEYELIINDLAGRIVRRITGLTGDQITLQRKELVAGMYFAHLRDESGNFATTKLVVE